MSLYTPRAALQSPRPYDAARLIRTSEKLVARLACRVRTDRRSQDAAELLLVTHSPGIDEAALLVVVPPSDGAGTFIAHALPISSNFHFSLNQTPPSPSSSFFHQSSRPPITLSLRSDSGNVDVRLSAGDSAKTQGMVTELRKQLDLARKQGAGVLTHGWLQYYPSCPPAGLEDDNETPSLSASTSSGLTPSTSSAALSTPLSALTIPAGGEEDEEHPNPYLPTFNRTAFLRKKVFLQQDEWASSAPLRIRLATYNVNDKLPPKDTMELANMVGKGDEHILVFGFQEVGNLRADDWEAALKRGLGDAASRYLKVAMTQYVGVMTIVFVRADIMGVVSDVQTSERGIGLLGFGGNKAGVAVRLKVHDTTLCFVNSHLAAFASALDRRRSDYATLLRGLTFSRPVGEVQAAYDEWLPDHPDKLISIEDAHVLFWMGDLNYRVNMEDDILRAWVGEERWPAILEKDQLRMDIEAGKSFTGFNEASIKFAPTYKYVYNSPALDDRRAPAYTDRILWSTPPPPSLRAQATTPGSSTPLKTPATTLSTSQSTTVTASSPSKPGPSLPRSTSQPTFKRSQSNSLLSTNFHPVKCTSYAAHTEVTWSDHRPVSATMETEVRVVDEMKRAEVFANARREIEKLEEIYRPALEVENASADFGEVMLRRTVQREVKLRNVGRVPAIFSFRAPGPSKPFCKPYFGVFPSEGVIAPGTEWTLKVVTQVQEEEAGKLTSGEDDLNDVLVLQVADGKDTFITLSGSFIPTIVNFPLELLPSLSGPIRDTPLAERKALLPPKSQNGYPALASSTSTSNVGLANVPSEAGAATITSPVEGNAPAGGSSGAEEAEPASTRPPPQRSTSRSAKPAKEIWRLLEHLMEHAAGVEDLWIGEVPDEGVLGIFDVGPSPSSSCPLSSLKPEALDTSSPLPSDAAVLVSRALLHILRFAPEALLPKMWHSICLSAGSRDEAYAALEGLPGVHTNILIGLTSVAKLCFDLSPPSSTPPVSISTSANNESATNGLSPNKDSSDKRYTHQLSALADAIFGGERLGGSVTSIPLQEKRIGFLELLLQG